MMALLSQEKNGNIEEATININIQVWGLIPQYVQDNTSCNHTVADIL